MKTIREFLDNTTCTRQEIDRFLNRKEPNWAQFDTELGYTLSDFMIEDGMDGVCTIASYGPAGERTTINYKDRPCRINTYGNSFTMGHQVSDGETWQEYLAAHFGEPIRNFGVGGYGVYQAYKRMCRVEQTASQAENVVLNIWGVDDHYRSIDAWRYLRVWFWFREERNRNMFHSNPWDHIRLNLNTGTFEEHPSLCPTTESLYQLCDPDWVYEQFSQDLVLRMFLAQDYGILENTDGFLETASALGVSLDFDDPDRLIAGISETYRRYALKATIWTLDQTREFCRNNNKRLLVLLSFGDLFVKQACEGLPRQDNEMLEYLDQEGFDYIDSLPRHVEDFGRFKLNAEDYIRQYYIGHYSPVGNHFFAFAIKEPFRKWLTPPPVTYRGQGDMVSFGGYLKGHDE